jgi:hypothetical protein
LCFPWQIMKLATEREFNAYTPNLAASSFPCNTSEPLDPLNLPGLPGLFIQLVGGSHLRRQ